MYQRRLKKERRFRRKLQEQLMGHEAKRRTQFEESLRSAPAEAFLGMQGEGALEGAWAVWGGMGGGWRKLSERRKHIDHTKMAMPR